MNYLLSLPYLHKNIMLNLYSHYRKIYRRTSLCLLCLVLPIVCLGKNVDKDRPKQRRTTQKTKTILSKHKNALLYTLVGVTSFVLGAGTTKYKESLKNQIIEQLKNEIIGKKFQESEGNQQEIIELIIIELIIELKKNIEQLKNEIIGKKFQESEGNQQEIIELIIELKKNIEQLKNEIIGKKFQESEGSQQEIIELEKNIEQLMKANSELLRELE